MSDVVPIYNVTEYKKAKLHINEIQKAISEIEISIQRLTPFEMYNTIRDSLTVLEASKMYLEIHLNKQKRILESKGRKDEIS